MTWWNNELENEYSNPLAYQAMLDNSPVGSVGAPSGVQPNVSVPNNRNPSDTLLGLVNAVPVTGDITGPVTEAYKLATDPNYRSLSNFALFGLGALPLVPSMMLLHGGGALSDAARMGAYKGQGGVIGYHGTRADFPNEEMYPLSHFGTRPQAANERLGYNPDGSSVMYPEVIQDFLSSDPDNSAFKGLLGGNIRRHDLNIKKPLRINDHGSGHKTILEHLMLSREAKGITQKEYDALTNIYNTYYKKSEALAETKTREALIKNLESKGYDGFVYLNDYEDMGKDSLMPFRNSQIEESWGRESKYGTYENYHHLGKYTGNEKFVRRSDINEGNAFFYKNKPYEIFDAKTGAPFGLAKTPEEAEKLIKTGTKLGYVLDYENVYEAFMKNKRK